MKRPMEEDDDAAAVDALFEGGPADENPEEPAAPIGPGEDEEGEDEDLTPTEAPETDEPTESPEVLVADLKATIDKLERTIGMLG